MPHHREDHRFQQLQSESLEENNRNPLGNVAAIISLRNQ